MKLPDAVIEKLRDQESPVTHAAAVEGRYMTIRYTSDDKVIGQTMFPYTREAWLDWFRSMMEEMAAGPVADKKKNKVRAAGRRSRTRASRSRRSHSRKRASRRRVKR